MIFKGFLKNLGYNISEHTYTDTFYGLQYLVSIEFNFY